MDVTKEIKPAIIQASLTVKHKEYLTPHYIRVTLTGEDVPKFAEATIGVNNKIFIPPAGVDEVYFPEFNFETGAWTHPPENVRPVVRTYTHRGIDLAKKEMVIDFVAHGDNGPASAWVIHAKPGDKLGVAMRARSSVLFPKADWYLLAGDATGLPVLAAILESLPATAMGIAYIEVQSKDDEQYLKTDAEIQIIWIHQPVPGESTLLADAVRATSVPDADGTTRFAYVAAEFSTVRDIRQFLRIEQGWKKEELYAYAYWKQGSSEDGSVKDRHQEHREEIN